MGLPSVLWRVVVIFFIAFLVGGAVWCWDDVAWVVEILPAAESQVNVANMRHLWLLPEAPAFAGGRSHERPPPAILDAGAEAAEAMATAGQSLVATNGGDAYLIARFQFGAGLGYRPAARVL